MSRPWVSSVLGVVALVLLLWGGSATCNFIKFESTITVAGQGVEPSTLNFGLWSYARYVIVQSGGYVTAAKVCVLYPDIMRPEADAHWEAARIIMGILWVLAVVMLVFACCTACRSKELDSLHGGAPLIYMLFCILSGLLFLVLDSNLCKNNPLVRSLNVDGRVTSVEFPETCSLGTGGILVAIATALWGLAGVLSVMAQRKASKSTEANEALTEALISDDV